jgi:hypothetical protein
MPALLKQAPGLDPRALSAGLAALHNLQAGNAKVRPDVLGVIDYSRPSTEPRFWVFDLVHSRVLFQEMVAHGKNSGDNLAVRFSNSPNSLMSSLGVYLTGEPYIGAHGLSLRLIGLEKGFNDNSLGRDIVIHAASYVNGSIAAQLGRIGRSWGCPAVRPEVSRQMVEALKGGAVLLAWYPDRVWLSASRLVNASTQPAPISPAILGSGFPAIALKSW